jgi:hypothetical protein
MTTDRYTKFILTVIALSLTVLAADKVYDAMIPEAKAGQVINCKVPGYTRSVPCAPVVVGKL